MVVSPLFGPSYLPHLLTDMEFFIMSLYSGNQVSFSLLCVFVCVCVCLQAVYTAFVPEDLPVNSVLLRVGATDADVGINAWIQYSLHGPESQDFSMDPDTGTDELWL